MPGVPADPTAVHPMPEQPRVVLLKPLVTSPLIEVGEFSYYDDPDDPTAFETRNVLYHYGPEKLVIGKFCALGEGVRFIMNGANHRMGGPSTFPFPIMGGSWVEHFDLITGLRHRGWQSGQAHPPPLQGGGRHPPSGAGLVGLATSAHHRAPPYDHVRQHRRP
jgi:virginiamycin A acetyltransferase